MKKRNVFATLALTAVLGTAMALPATASAHEVIKEKRVKVIKTSDRHHGHVDRRYVERHREVTRWAPPRRGHKHRHHRNHQHDRGHHYGHRKPRHAHRDYRRVEHEPVYRQRDRDGVRVRIDYDFWL